MKDHRTNNKFHNENSRYSRKPHDNQRRNSEYSKYPTRTGSTKVIVTLFITYDLPPSRYNKTEIEKVLAMSLHELGKDNNLSWADVAVKNYFYKINMNPRKRIPNKDTRNEKGATNE